MENVSWKNAQEFIGRLNAMTVKHFVFRLRPNGNTQRVVDTKVSTINTVAAIR